MNELARRDWRAQDDVARVRQELVDSRKRLAVCADVVRDDLRDGVADLKRGAQELKHKFSWKSWVARNPWGFVVGAAAVGLFVGTRSRS